MEFADPRDAITHPVLGPPHEAERWSEIVGIAPPLGNGRRASSGAEHVRGDHGEDRGQGADQPAAVPVVRDVAKDVAERGGRRVGADRATPSLTNYKQRWVRSQDS